MRYIKWLGLFAVALLVYACFSPWVYIESRQLTVSGMESTGTNFGKPAFFHFFMTVFFIVFSLIPRVWAKRSNLLVTALNLGWALRNYVLITACQAGDCPDKKTGIWLLLLASLLMLVSSLFPDMKLPVEKEIK